MKRFVLGVLTLAFVSAPTWRDAVAAPAVSAPFQTVGVGDTFNVDISVTDAVDLQFLQFDLSFNPSIVQAGSFGAQAGAALPGDWFFTSPGAIDNTSGSILGVSASGSPFNGSGVVASFEFTALATGVSPLNFSNVFLNLSDSGFDAANGQITVSAPIPEPTSLAMLLAGLGFFGARRFTARSRT